jgi:hypothetical protein
MAVRATVMTAPEQYDDRGRYGPNSRLAVFTRVRVIQTRSIGLHRHNSYVCLADEVQLPVISGPDPTHLLDILHG